MSGVRLACCFGLLACSLTHSAEARNLHQGGCPFNPSQRALNFAGVKAECGAGKDLCTSCIRAIYDAFVPAFQAADLTYDPKSPSTFPKSKADDIMKACAPGYVLQATTAGVNVNSLWALQKCPGDVRPACLTHVFEKLTPEAKAAAAATPAPEPDAAQKAFGTVQGAVGGAATAGQKVVEAQQKVVNGGRQVVDAMGSASKSIRDVFGG